MADNPKRSVGRESLRALAERMAEECRLEQPLAEACELKLRVWEAGRRTEDWRLIVVRRGSGREYQVRTWADWEAIKRLAGGWSSRTG
jgi:hypothetical protein